MSDGLARYRASGRTSIRFVPAFLIAAALAVGAGWTYQALATDHYIILNVVYFVGFAAVIGGLVVAAGRLGRNRNRTVGALAALALAAAGLGTAYAVEYRAAAEAAEPATLTVGQWLDARVAAGWTYWGRDAGDPGTVTGWQVWLVWIGEALIISVIALVGGVAFPPFCERCGRWMSVRPLFTRGGLDDAAVEAKAKATTLDALFALPPAATTPARTDRWELAYSAHRCPQDHGDAYVTVVARRVVGTTRSPRKESRTLKAQVAVPAERLQRLQRLPPSAVTPA